MPYGKRLPTAVYLLDLDDVRVPQLLRATCSELRRRLEIGPEFNLLKFGSADLRLSFLEYPDFDTNPHPELARSVVVNLTTGKVRRDDYRGRKNPPILHRKELFVPPEYPHRTNFERLTALEESAGILADTVTIGFKLNWERLVADRGLAIEDHSLRLLSGREAAGHDHRDTAKPLRIRIARERTALVRTEASRPVKLILETGQLRRGDSFFDYGCGQGADVASVAALGFPAGGWDPHFAPDGVRGEASVVNLGYVLNVIEDPAERVETLLGAWHLARRLLVVSTLVTGEEGYSDIQLYADGVLTKRATFQKYFEQGELHSLLEDTLHCEAVPVALGVFFVFRQVADLHDFLAARTRRFVDWNGISRKLGLIRATSKKGDPYETHRELMEAFWQAALSLGRIPHEREFSQLAEVRSACGSVPKAFRLLSDRFGAGAFEAARARSREDLLVYAAASLLRKRIPFSQLSATLQRDFRSHFGTHSKGEELARELLYASGDPDEMDIALHYVPFGEKEPIEGHFTFHRDLLDELPAVFRAYVACGARLFGDPRQADLIKIHLQSKKLTFLHYDSFDGETFPMLTTRIKIDLRRMFVTVFQYPPNEESQVLLFKERYLAKDHPRRSEMEAVSIRLRGAGVTEENVGHGPTNANFRAWLRDRGFDRQMHRDGISIDGGQRPLLVIPKAN